MHKIQALLATTAGLIATMPGSNVDFLPPSPFREQERDLRWKESRVTVGRRDPSDDERTIANPKIGAKRRRRLMRRLARGEG